MGCFWHEHTCQSIQDVSTNGETLAERYEQTMNRLEQITGVVKAKRECEFEEETLKQNPELQMHPLVEYSPLNTRDALYEGRTEAMRLHYKI